MKARQGPRARSTCGPPRRVAVAALLTVACAAAAVGGVAQAATVTPGWSLAAEMETPRFGATATLLVNGKVLVAGGTDRVTGNSVASTELFDPKSETWAPAASMGTPRSNGHTATLLRDGRVLVAGGLRQQAGQDTEFLRSAEVYDPTTDRWTPVQDEMNHSHFASHAAAALEDGRVLVVSETFGAEVFNPATGDWHYDHVFWAGGDVATMLQDEVVNDEVPDKVLVFGRSGAALFDPVLSRFDHPTQWPAGGPRRSEATATRLRDGSVLVAGGQDASDASDLDGANLYHPGLNAWAPAASLGTGRGDHTATLLANGNVMVAGGMAGSTLDQPLSSAEVYDPVTNRWSPGSSMSEPRNRHTATLLGNGKVLVVGGGPRTAELWTPQTSLAVAGRLDFGDRTVGTGGATASLEVTNTGDSPLLLTGAALQAASGGEITLGDDRCSVAPVPPGGACAIELSFAPTRTGSQSVTVAFQANTASVMHAVEVTGRGVAPVRPPECSTLAREDGRPVGVTIEEGAKYTKRPGVELTIIPPDAATGVLISNDGGFGNPFGGPLQTHSAYAWTLASSGSERLPKTVYVRFAGVCVDASQTYQDDIILDQTPPTVTAVSLVAAKGRASASVLRVRARDNASRVRFIQVRLNRRKATRTFAFASHVRLKGLPRRATVRVRDGAGNPSRWRTVKARYFEVKRRRGNHR